MLFNAFRGFRNAACSGGRRRSRRDNYVAPVFIFVKGGGV